MKSLFFLTSFNILIFSCCTSESELTEKQRIDKLSSIKSDDEFMNVFLTYLKNNNTIGSIVKYETELLKRKELEGTDLDSYKKYFEYLIKSSESNDASERCVNKDIQKKFTHPFFLNSDEYKEYDKKVKNGLIGSQDYKYITILASAGSPTVESIKFWIYKSKLTSERRYFYLMVTMPTKTCD
jgi:hypothetical protein